MRVLPEGLPVSGPIFTRTLQRLALALRQGLGFRSSLLGSRNQVGMLMMSSRYSRDPISWAFRV